MNIARMTQDQPSLSLSKQHSDAITSRSHSVNNSFLAPVSVESPLSSWCNYVQDQQPLPTATNQIVWFSTIKWYYIHVSKVDSCALLRWHWIIPKRRLQQSKFQENKNTYTIFSYYSHVKLSLFIIFNKTNLQFY